MTTALGGAQRFGPRWAVPLFFAIFFTVGCAIYQDYGLSWDEEISRLDNGLINYRFIFHHDKTLLQATEKYHGPAFEIVLIILERSLGLKDTRTIYFMRHLVTFLVFYLSVAAFYWLVRERFESWKAALFGAAAMVLSPRIFADAFFNSKDLPLLSFFIFSAATFLLFDRGMNAKRAVLHAVICGFLIDIRIVGIVVPCMTFFLTGSRILLALWERRAIAAQVRALALYAVSLAMSTILFWPILWKGPVKHLVLAFEEMSKYPWGGLVLYQGQFLKATALPWHYIPVWIAITTPALYTGLFVLGIGGFLFTLVRWPLKILKNNAIDLALLGSLTVPVAAIVFMKSVIYDGWRHLFFIYPAILFFSCHGLVMLWNGAGGLKSWARPARWALGAAVAASLAQTATVMARYHPHENVYFCCLPGWNMQKFKREYEMDYWGLSCRRALEYLVATDRAPEIRIYGQFGPAKLNALMLPAEERRRLHYVESEAKADYFLSFYRCHPAEFPTEDEIHSVKVDGVKICVLRKPHSQIAPLARQN
jgi:hypothetical protein